MLHIYYYDYVVIHYIQITDNAVNTYDGATF